MITDLTYLKSMANEDIHFIKEMIDIFKVQIEEYSIKMPELLAKEDYENLSKLAHKAKSSVAVMGMSKEAEILGKLENNARARIEIQTYKSMVDTFVEHAAEAVTELNNQVLKS